MLGDGGRSDFPVLDVRADMIRSMAFLPPTRTECLQVVAIGLKPNTITFPIRQVRFDCRGD